MKWNADKAGKVNIHTYKFPNERGFLNPGQIFGAEQVHAGVRLRSQRHLPGARPGCGRGDEDGARGQADRIGDARRGAQPGTRGQTRRERRRPGRAMSTSALGKEDKLISATSLKVTGGKQLSVKYAINLRLLPYARSSRAAASVPRKCSQCRRGRGSETQPSRLTPSNRRRFCRTAGVSRLGCVLFFLPSDWRSNATHLHFKMGTSWHPPGEHSCVTHWF